MICTHFPSYVYFNKNFKNTNTNTEDYFCREIQLIRTDQFMISQLQKYCTTLYLKKSKEKIKAK